jgi:gamma-glutamyltranspeptidase/glutathione hydrolase
LISRLHDVKRGRSIWIKVTGGHGNFGLYNRDMVSRMKDWNSFMKTKTREIFLPAIFLFSVLGLQSEQVLAAEPVYGSNAIVVAQEPLAADVGLDVIKRGGNAVDAAVAVGFALAVTYPYAGNLGGGGFMLVRMADGRTTFIDFRETAPRRASWDMFMHPDVPTNASLQGWLAVAVPGTVRGFEMAYTNYGTMEWRSLLEPAIRLAADGFPISHWQMENFRANAAWLSRSNSPDSERIFLNNGSYYQWGERFRQPELARTLKRIARDGARDFYEGETALLMVNAMQRHGGLITMEDLRNYRAKEREPLRIDYHGYRMITSPLPSSGGFCLRQMFSMLEGSGYDTEGAGSAKEYHYLADVMRLSYSDRDKYLADPDFVGLPLLRLTNPRYLQERRASIDPDKATAPEVIGREIPANTEGNNTTHFSIIDSHGNAVAVTYTLNAGYGSGVTVPNAGFLLNDEMNDFTTQTNRPNLFGVIQSTNNFIAPGKRPLSSMTPTIVLAKEKPFLVLGAPGGTRIPSAVLQVILNVIDFHMGIQDAVDFPRIHAQGTNTLMDIERGVSPDTVKLLTNMGYRRNSNSAPVVARVEAIMVKDGTLEGAHDGRGNGKAAGW